MRGLSGKCAVQGDNWRSPRPGPNAKATVQADRAGCSRHDWSRHEKRRPRAACAGPTFAWSRHSGRGSLRSNEGSSARAREAADMPPELRSVAHAGPRGERLWWLPAQLARWWRGIRHTEECDSVSLVAEPHSLQPARHQRHCRGRRIMGIFCVAAAAQSESDGPRGAPSVSSGHLSHPILTISFASIRRGTRWSKSPRGQTTSPKFAPLCQGRCARSERD